MGDKRCVREVIDTPSDRVNNCAMVNCYEIRQSANTGKCKKRTYLKGGKKQGDKTEVINTPPNRIQPGIDCICVFHSASGRRKDV